jgi:TPR repeat protein
MNDVLVKRLEGAAEGADHFAQVESGVWFDYGYDGDQDFEAATGWYSRAAAEGHMLGKVTSFLNPSSVTLVT